MPDLSLASEYACWFVNRRAHTRQSDRPHPESGRHYYYRPPGERALSADDIRRHLAGEITVGLYAIHPQTQRVKWMAIDADYKRSLDDLIKLQYELPQDGIQARLNRAVAAVGVLRSPEQCRAACLRPRLQQIFDTNL